MSSESNRYGMDANSNYKVYIAQAGTDLKVQAYVPETFQLAVTSQFNQPFGQGIQNSPIGTASKVLGLGALSSQSMTAQVWEGTQPIEMSLELEFVAESSPVDEVQKPILDLLRMTMPGRKGNTFLLDPPGPVYSELLAQTAFETWDQFSNAKRAEGRGGASREISIKIGNFLVFDNVVIESVNTTFHSMMHETGVPLRATCAVTFKTFFIQLKEDIPNIFVQSSGGSGIGGDRGTRGGA